MEKKEKRIQLSDHFTYRRLLRFVISPILMMICTSLYSIVDGFFVSNFVGKTPFAAVNLIMPIAMGVAAIGFMIGTGGSAIVSKTLGEGKPDKANEYFSLLIYTAIGISVTLSILGFIFIRQISILLGASGELLENCVVYGRILFVSMPAFILMNIFQNFFIAAEKPSLSLKVSLMAGITNVILDFVFIVVLKWGIAGAAWATAAGEFLGGIVPMIYFLRKNDSLLQLTKTTFNGRILLKAFTNGSSEMVTNLSQSVVGVLYNFQLMRLAGESGVAAYGIIMYVNFIFMAIFFGYSIGTGPIVAYQYGAGNHEELRNVFKKSIRLVVSTGVTLTLLAEVLNVPLIKVFASYDQEMFDMTSHGFRIYAIAFLVIGVNVWGSAFFTALNNGVVSAAISFLRTLIFQVSAILILPAILGIDGVWFAVVAAEGLALLVTTTFLIKNKTKYKYS